MAGGGSTIEVVSYIFVCDVVEVVDVVAVVRRTYPAIHTTIHLIPRRAVGVCTISRGRAPPPEVVQWL